MNQNRYTRFPRLRTLLALLPLIALASCTSTPASANAPSLAAKNSHALLSTAKNTWSVNQNGTILQIGYGSGTNFPQYAALDLNSGYLRMVYSTTSQWGTSVVLLPALWSQAACPTDYCQGAPITATWKTMGTNLVFSIQGTIATLNVASTLALTPPANNVFAAQVSTKVTGTIKLDNRPGEAFKPVMLSSMHISSTEWDSQAAFSGTQTYSYPSSGWILQPPIVTRNFGLQGGTSSYKVNAPTVEIALDQGRQVTGWVTSSTNTNDDNIGFWCATSKVLASWSFGITAEAGPNL